MAIEGKTTDGEDYKVAIQYDEDGRKYILRLHVYKGGAACKMTAAGLRELADLCWASARHAEMIEFSAKWRDRGRDGEWGCL